jgi:hypothetical protein
VIVTIGDETRDTEEEVSGNDRTRVVGKTEHSTSRIAVHLDDEALE